MVLRTGEWNGIILLPVLRGKKNHHFQHKSFPLSMQVSNLIMVMKVFRHKKCMDTWKWTINFMFWFNSVLVLITHCKLYMKMVLSFQEGCSLVVQIFLRMRGEFFPLLPICHIIISKWYLLQHDFNTWTPTIGHVWNNPNRVKKKVKISVASVLSYCCLKISCILKFGVNFIWINRFV